MRQKWYLALGLAVLAALLVTSAAPVAEAAAYTVTKTEDAADGSCDLSDCSLREAIIAANGNTGADTITVPAGTYRLSIAGTGENAAATGDLDVTDDLTINGAGAGSTIIDGGGVWDGGGSPSGWIDRVFHFDPGASGITVKTSGVTVSNGLEPNSMALGGGIYNYGATATLTDVTVSSTGGRAAAYGGGIANTGTLTLTNSTVSANTATFDGGGIANWGTATATLTNVTVSGNSAPGTGGGVYNTGTATLTNVTVSGNSANVHAGGIYNTGTATLTNVTVSGNSVRTGGSGGGFYNSAGTATLTNVTVSGNSAPVFGGGISNNSGTATLTNVTVSGNTGGWGGGIATWGPATATLTNVTVNGNTGGSDGGGIYNDGTSATLTNTIVANSGSGGDCSGTITSGGYNLDSDGTCGLDGTGDLPDTDPMLGPLADNGGPTKTHALLPMTCFDDMCLPYTPSEAIDAADSGACPSTDQRGVARPQGGACDIGAFELTKRGDIDCNGGVNSVDALNLLRFVAGLSVSQQPGCTPIGASLPLPIPTWPPAHFGDVDCDGAVNAVDALKVLRYVAGLSVSQELGCTELGTTSGTG